LARWPGPRLTRDYQAVTSASPVPTTIVDSVLSRIRPLQSFHIFYVTGTTFVAYILNGELDNAEAGHRNRLDFEKI
jgi:hypothetical protein